MYPPQQQQPQQKAPTFWDSMGLPSKIILVLGVALLVTTLLFGFSMNNLNDFVISLVRVGFAAGLIFFAFYAFMQKVSEKKFSATEDFRVKVITSARLLKPPNVQKLWLRGDEMRSRALIGNIDGLGWIPYLSAKPKRDTNGNIIYCLDRKGKQILNKETKEPIPEYEIIEDDDGDSIFVVKQGFMGLGEPLCIRCHRKFHTELVGDVYIKDVGLAPFGEWFYPSKQWQSQIQRVQTQNQLEAILIAYFKDLDLAQTATEMSIAIDPYFSKILATKNEEIARAPPMTGVPVYSSGYGGMR